MCPCATLAHRQEVVRLVFTDHPDLAVDKTSSSVRRGHGQRLGKLDGDVRLVIIGHRTPSCRLRPVAH